MSESIDDLAKTHVTEPAIPAAEEFSTGQIVGGKYKIISLLGRGGIGSVYKVEQIFLAQHFALKTLNSQKASDQLIRRFQNEARAASSLSHPNLVKVIDFGLLDGEQPYLVMDLVEGKTLSEHLKNNGVLNLEQAVSCFAQVCLGLSYAHDQGVIHRDIKPSNIMISSNQPFGSEGFVKVVDFGIAKLAYAEDGETQSLTTTGEIFGSPLYMSPEQCFGLAVDYRCDIYSLGCVLFESLVGTPPHVGQNALSTMMLHQSQQAPALKEASLGKDFPRELEQLVSKMLAKAPSDRYQNLGIVANDLAQISKGAPVLGVSTVVKKSAKVVEPLKMSRREFQLWIAMTAVTSSLVTLTIAYFAMQPQSAGKIEDSKAHPLTAAPAKTEKNDGPLVKESDPDVNKVLERSDQQLETGRFERDFYASFPLVDQNTEDPAKLAVALSKYNQLQKRASENIGLSRRFGGALEQRIAYCYTKMHRYSDAAGHLRDGLNLTADPNVRTNIAQNFCVLADQMLHAGQAQKAFDFWSDATNVFSAVSRTPGLSREMVLASRRCAGNTMRCSSALCFQYLKDPQKGIQIGKQSAALLVDGGDEYLYACTLLNLGAAQNRANENDDAKQSFQSAVEIFKRSKSTADDRVVNLANCYHELSAIEMKLGNTAKARDYCLKSKRTIATAKPQGPQLKKFAAELLANTNKEIKTNGW